MAICTVLEQKLDSRSEGRDCAFNGLLGEWTGMDELQDSVLKEAFRTILQKEPMTRICTDLCGAVSKEAVSNQIIRYRDIYKVSTMPLRYPYILYLTKGSQEKALLVLPYSEDGYLYAKGMYYCMTEPAGEFNALKNDLAVISENDPEAIAAAFSDLFEMKAGFLQRRIDKNRFADYEVLYGNILKAAEGIADNAPAQMKGVRERSALVTSDVARWFLLKKVAYVQYMVNRTMLSEKHAGNVRKQRNAAKEHADNVRFISIHDLWQLPY